MATLRLAETAPEFVRYERMGEIAYSKQQGERFQETASPPTRDCSSAMP